MSGIWKNIQLNVRSFSQIVQKFPEELKPQGALMFQEP